jgi:hypothetical protein
MLPIGTEGVTIFDLAPVVHLLQTTFAGMIGPQK